MGPTLLVWAYTVIGVINMKNKNLPINPLVNNQGRPFSNDYVKTLVKNDAVGLTKREYFAALITQGICAANPDISHDIPKYAVTMADALLEELEKKGE